MCIRDRCSAATSLCSVAEPRRIAIAAPPIMASSPANANASRSDLRRSIGSVSYTHLSPNRGWSRSRRSRPPIDFHHAGFGIDQPGKLRAIDDPLAHFFADGTPTVGKRSHFNHKVRAQVPVALDHSLIESLHTGSQGPGRIGRPPRAIREDKSDVYKRQPETRVVEIYRRAGTSRP